MIDRDSSSSYQIIIPGEGTAGGAGTEAGPRQVHPIRKLHRLMRGRYRWVAVFGLIGVALGGFLGFSSARPIYRCPALLYVEPIIRSSLTADRGRPHPNLTAFVDAQVVFLKDRRILRHAAESDAYREIYKEPIDESITRLLESVTVASPRRGLNIFVTAEAETPRAAQIIVQEVIKAYQSLSRRDELQRDQESLTSAERQETLFTTQISDHTERISRLADEHGSAEIVKALHDGWIGKYTDAASAVRDNIEQLRLNGVQVTDDEQLEILPHDDTKPVKGPEPVDLDNLPAAEDIAFENSGMRDLLIKRDLLNANLEDMLGRQKLADLHASVLTARRELEILEKHIHQLRVMYAKRMATGGLVGSATDPVPLLKRQLEIQKRVRHNARVEQVRLGRTLNAINLEISRREAVIEKRDRLQEVIASLNDSLTGKGRVIVKSWGEMHNDPAEDPRVSNALMGGFGLGGLGIGLIVLLALFDRRLRSSVDVAGNNLPVRMLGLLPLLDKGIHERDGAQIAKHTVHHIRTLLQIAYPAEEKGRTLCITGPAADIGKTTLTVALGLSFSASSSKTLLIDCDFSGKGLTRHFNAMLRRQIQESIRTARASDAGFAAEGDAIDPDEILNVFKRKGRITPEMVRQLLAEITETMGIARARRDGTLGRLITLARQSLSAGERENHTRELIATLDAAGRVDDDERREIIQSLRTPPGMLHAINGGLFRECTVHTDSERLDLLPLGYGAEEYATKISVARISEVFEQARSEYETVLVDTGPVPGSLDASLVAAQTDSVIVIVTRGQARADVDRSLAYLRSIRAEVAGLVFNRAEMSDALKVSSSHSLSLRSQVRDDNTD